MGRTLIRLHTTARVRLVLLVLAILQMMMAWSLYNGGGNSATVLYTAVAPALGFSGLLSFWSFLCPASRRAHTWSGGVLTAVATGRALTFLLTPLVTNNEWKHSNTVGFGAYAIIAILAWAAWTGLFAVVSVEARGVLDEPDNVGGGGD